MGMTRRRGLVRLIKVGSALALLAALFQPSPVNAHGGTCSRITGSASPVVSPGEIKSWATFNDGTNSDGVPVNFQSDDDFNQNHCERWIPSGGEVQKSRLYDETSNSNCCGPGDLSIYRLHEASGGQSYVAGGSFDLLNYGGDFRGVIKITAWSTESTCLKVNGSCWEKITKICVSSAYAACEAYDGTDTHKALAVSGTLPANTNFVKFVFRGRRAQDDAYGTVEMDRIWYCRGC